MYDTSGMINQDTWSNNSGDPCLALELFAKAMVADITVLGYHHIQYTIGASVVKMKSHCEFLVHLPDSA